MHDETFEIYLERYIQVMIQVGMNVQAGDWVRINTQLEAAPLVRRITRALYERGVTYVDVQWVDRATDRMRLEYAPQETLTLVPDARRAAEREFLDHRGVTLALKGEDPNWLAGVSSERISIWRRAVGEKMKDLNAEFGVLNPRWLVAGYPSPSWAQTVFPNESADRAVERLWEAIFRLCRCDQPDPVAAWQAHTDDLKKRMNYLNAKGYTSLNLLGDGTDLLVGLADQHFWEGGGSTDGQGLIFVPNMPTEEVFTAPHRNRVSGVVKTTKPYQYMGNRIEGATFHFEEGRVTSFSAETGEETLRTMLDTDENSRRLGEIALVPFSSPVGQTGLLFYNTLFDENAACHMAFGRGYGLSIRDSEGKSVSELGEYGLNDSIIHEDMMIGSATLDVDGILPDGRVEPLMRQGEWAFSV